MLPLALFLKVLLIINQSGGGALDSMLLRLMCVKLDSTTALETQLVPTKVLVIIVAPFMCLFLGPAQFECSCHEGYGWIHGRCVEL